MFNKFTGHQVEITVNQTTTFQYGYFNYRKDDDNLMLYDEMNPDCTTYIPLSTVSIANTTTDLYDDIVTINYDNNILTITCAECRPVLPKCFRCGHEIHIPEETIWHLNGQANFGSHYEDTGFNSACLCDDCVHVFIGEVEENVA
jgi:hypothetical protein